MAWITNDDVHINMDRVAAFWWERSDDGKGYLMLNYKNGEEIVALRDNFQILYHAACVAAGVKFQPKKG